MRQTMCGFRLTVLLVVGAGMVQAYYPVPGANPNELGDEPELRTEFSRTFSKGKGRFATQIFTVPINYRNQEGQWVPWFSDTTRRCYPDDATYWTGTVSFKGGNQYNKSDRSVQVTSEPPNNSIWWRQGWFKFDLTPIPDSVTIDTVSINYYCSYASNNPQPSTYVRLLPGDPVPTSASILWNWVTTGDTVTPASSHGTGWLTRQLLANGTAAVQASLGRNWVAFGLHEWTHKTGAEGTMQGHGSGAETPYLEVSYTFPPRTDISAEEVLEPVGTIYTNTVVTPTGRWRNWQPHSDNYDAWFIFIDPAGRRTTMPGIHVNGQRGLSDTVLYFAPFDVGTDTGRWVARCSTFAPGDIHPENDVIERFFRVVLPPSGNFDVAAVEVISPVGSVDTGTVVAPKGRWQNLSSQTADFFAYCGLTNPQGIREYSQSFQVIGLEPGEDTVITFPGHSVGNNVGRWAVCCSTVAVRDTYPANDWLRREFAVYAGGGLVRGWHELKPVPLAPSGRAVKDGGWLTLDNGSGFVYAAKGNKVGDFYRYDPAGDSWQTLALWKGGIENKGPAKGSVGVADGYGRVYAVKGNNTLGFWCYFSDGDSWHQLPDVPLGITRKKVKGGSDLVYLEENGLPYVYLLKGYKNEFFRFNIAADSWEQLPEAPQAVYPKWDKGSWLVYDGLRYIYAHKAKYHEFWRFDCWSATWDTHQLKGMPFLSRTGKTKRSKDGGSGAWNDGFIYALKGGNTCEFYKYDVAGDSWTELDTMPSVGSTGKKKRVKAGGDLVAAGPGLFYALKGNKTREFWYYYEPRVDAPLRWDNGGVAALAISTRWLALAPNPAKERVQLRFDTAGAKPVRVRVYDIRGALVIEKRFAGREPGTRDLVLKQLAEGVYLVRVEGSGLAAVQKLVIQH